MILIAMVATTLLQAQADSLYGVVRAVGGEGIPGVRVSARGVAQFTLTDTSGRYALRGVTGDRIELRFERLGFRALTVQVIAGDGGGGSASVDVDLAPAAVALDPVAVYRAESSASRALDSTIEVGDTRLTSNSASRNPLVGESDELAELATAPFIAGREELSSSLRVHGGSSDENLVLLDGLPWRGPHPPGGNAGMLSSATVTAVDVHTAVPPARYGGALSSVMLLQPQAGEHMRADGALDPTAIEQAAGIPFASGRATLYVSGRQTYRSVWSQADETRESPNGYGDLFGHLSTTGPHTRWDFYLLASREKLAFPARTDAQEDSGPAAPVPQNDFVASGALGGVVWTDSLGDAKHAQARLWYSEVAAGVVWNGLQAASDLGDFGVNAEWVDGETEAGVSISRVATTYRVHRGMTPVTSLSAGPLVTALFASQRWTPADPWTVSTGVRLAATSTGLYVEPRLWSHVAIGEGSFSLGYARLHQYVQSARNDEAVIDALNGSDLPLAGIPPARSDQVTASLAIHAGSRSTLEINVYRRWLAGLVLTPLVTLEPFADSAILVGRGSAWGEEATFNYEADRLDLRLQFGLLDSQRRAGAAWYRTGDSRARAALGSAYRLGDETVVRLAMFAGSQRASTPLRDGMELQSAGVEGIGELAGSPEALAGAALNGIALPDYLRTDIGISKVWRTRRGAPRLSAALTVANIFDHHNVLAFVGSPGARQPVFLLSRTLWLRVRWHLAGL